MIRCISLYMVFVIMIPVSAQEMEKYSKVVEYLHLNNDRIFRKCIKKLFHKRSEYRQYIKRNTFFSIADTLFDFNLIFFEDSLIKYYKDDKTFDLEDIKNNCTNEVTEIKYLVLPWMVEKTSRKLVLTLSKSCKNFIKADFTNHFFPIRRLQNGLIQQGTMLSMLFIFDEKNNIKKMFFLTSYID